MIICDLVYNVNYLRKNEKLFSNFPRFRNLPADIGNQGILIGFPVDKPHGTIHILNRNPDQLLIFTVPHIGICNKNSMPVSKLQIKALGELTYLDTRGEKPALEHI